MSKMHFITPNLCIIAEQHSTLCRVLVCPHDPMAHWELACCHCNRITQESRVLYHISLACSKIRIQSMVSTEVYQVNTNSQHLKRIRSNIVLTAVLKTSIFLKSYLIGESSFKFASLISLLNSSGLFF